VEELEGLLQEREELDDITLRRELEALSTRETCLDSPRVGAERYTDRKSPPIKNTHTTKVYLLFRKPTYKELRG
jgi:hypothetical protein